MDRELVITRVFDAPRDLVFQTWTDPEHIASWWGPKGFTNTIYEMDVRPGGVWRFVTHGPDGVDYQNKIIYVEIAKPERLVYNHGEESEPGHSQVTVTFAEQGGKTKLTMRMLFKSAAERDKVVKEFNAIEGANQTLDRLAEQLAKKAVDRELVITRIFDAPRELVFKAWTEPERFKLWWGPKGFTTPFCKIDLRLGGVIHFCMRSPDGRDYWCKGVFQEIVEPERIVFTDYFSDEAGNRVPPADYGMPPELPSETLVTVTFADQEGKTKLTMRQSILEPVAKSIGAVQGWSESFDRLAGLLTNTNARRS
jgi:uncharacterized protein YndB with AHSA1/START domain